MATCAVGMLFTTVLVMSPDAPGGVDFQLRAVIESSPSGLLVADPQGNIVFVNREVERLFGYARAELLGQPVEIVIPERFRTGHAGFRAGFMEDPKARAMGAGRDLYGLRKDQAEVPIEIGLTPVVTEEGLFVLASIVDITGRKKAEEERRHLEEQLRHALRLEALGTLAGGVAHDFNNVLAAITAYAERIGQALPAQGTVAEDLAELTNAIRHGRTVERIRIFSRRPPAEAGGRWKSGPRWPRRRKSCAPCSRPRSTSGSPSRGSRCGCGPT